MSGDRWGQECARRKQRTGDAEQPIADEDRHVHSERPQNLSESHAVDEFIEGDQAALSHELLLHERDYGHASSEADAADLQKCDQQAAERNRSPAISSQR